MTINAGEDAQGKEVKEPFYTDGGNVNHCRHYENQYGNPSTT
jgi:hypothetical protein